MISITFLYSISVISSNVCQFGAVNQYFLAPMGLDLVKNSCQPASFTECKAVVAWWENIGIGI